MSLPLSMPLFSFLEFHLHWKEGLKGIKSSNGNFGVVCDILDSKSLFNTSFLQPIFVHIKSIVCNTRKLLKMFRKSNGKVTFKTMITRRGKHDKFTNSEFYSGLLQRYFKKSSKKQKIIKYSILLMPCTCK